MFLDMSDFDILWTMNKRGDSRIVETMC